MIFILIKSVNVRQWRSKYELWETVETLGKGTEFSERLYKQTVRLIEEPRGELEERTDSV